MRDAFDEFMDELRRRRAAIDGSDDAGETGSNGESNAETGARDKTSGGEAREDETVDTNRSGPGTDGDPEGEDETPRPISRGGFGGGFGGGRRTRGMGPSDDFPQINISRRWVVLFIAIIVAFSLITTFFTVGIQLTTDAIWYQSIGFAGVFWTRIWSQLGLFVLGAAAAFTASARSCESFLFCSGWPTLSVWPSTCTRAISGCTVPLPHSSRIRRSRSVRWPRRVGSTT